MSRLLQRAKANFTTAKFCYGCICEDDAFLDNCCFALQQTIEMAMKFIIEANGVKYAKTHDLRAHLNQLQSLEIKIPNNDELRNMALTLNSWEAEARYFDSFIAVIKDVDLAMEYAGALLDYAESFYVPNESAAAPIDDF